VRLHLVTVRSWRRICTALAESFDRVSFEFGGRRVTGLVIEDRGNLGYQGARLLAVRLPRTDADDVIVEMTDDELQAA
jgi:hypothetical protein